jgi:hypothetical protein
MTGALDRGPSQTGLPPAMDLLIVDGLKRITTLEGKVEALKTQPKSFVDRLSAWSALLTPIITGVIGFWFVGSVNLRLDVEKTRVANLAQIEGLIKEMRDSSASSATAEAAAQTLAAFGPVAITPFLNLLQIGEPNLVNATETGLRATGMGFPKETCERMIAVLQNRTPLYSWETDRIAARIVGDLHCKKALAPLSSLKELLPKNAAAIPTFLPYVSETNPPTIENVRELDAEIDRAVKIIKQ